MTTTNNNANKWNLSLTSEQETWKRLFLSNFLKTLPFISTNYRNVKAWGIKPIVIRRLDFLQTFHFKSLLGNQYILLTLFDIMIVSNALFEAFIATFKVVACSNTNKVCNITYPIVSKKWGKTPMCSRFRPFGSVAVQKSASMVSCPKAENKRSPTCEW